MIVGCVGGGKGVLAITPGLAVTAFRSTELVITPPLV